MSRLGGKQSDEEETKAKGNNLKTVHGQRFMFWFLLLK